METTPHVLLPAIIFEHACKENLQSLLYSILEDDGKAANILIDTVKVPTKHPKHVILLLYILKRLQQSKNFATELSSHKIEDQNALVFVADLLKTAFQQQQFLSHRKFFTLITELNLLDLLNLISSKASSSTLIQKLNSHFPRWNAEYSSQLEKYFSVENPKLLTKVEESHTQCRRLVLKLVADKSFKVSYMSTQKENDVDRMISESKSLIGEAVINLEKMIGPSTLESLVNQERDTPSDDINVQLLMEYVHPELTEEQLLKYLREVESVPCTQSHNDFISCLLPFTSPAKMSANDEDMGSSDSEHGSSDEEMEET